MINVTEEVRRDVIDTIEQQKLAQEGLPVHQFIYDEIIDLVKKARLTPCFEHP